jgi:hypothetical protein
VKKIKPRYPRRREMLATPFEPLSEEEFRKLAASGLAIPCQQGTSFFVAKWKDGPGMDAETFLTGLRAQGSTLEVRRFKADVNIRVVRSLPAAAGDQRSSTPSRAVLQ